MKLAFSTLGCPEWTLEQAIDKAVEYGFHGIEIRGIRNELNAEKIEELNAANRESTLLNAKNNGIEFCCLGASASFHEKEKQQVNMQEALATVRQASACKIPYIRIFGNSLTQEDINAQMKDIASRIRILCQEAQMQQVTVLLEVHGDFNTSERILRTADFVACDNFGIIWDIKHSREDPHLFWKHTKHLIRHIHLKDSINDDLCNFGEGTIGVENIVRMTANDGYEGFYSLEWEKRWHPQLRDASEEFPHFVHIMNNILC